MLQGAAGGCAGGRLDADAAQPYSPRRAEHRRSAASSAVRVRLVLKKIFTWWNGATLGALFTIAKRGVFVGEDEFGNRYYEAKDEPRQLRRPPAPLGDLQGLCRGLEDPARLARLDAPHLRRAADHGAAEAPRRGRLDHLPNLTGTPRAYRPQGSIARGGERAQRHRRLRGLAAGVVARPPSNGLKPASGPLVLAAAAAFLIYAFGHTGGLGPARRL